MRLYGLHLLDVTIVLIYLVGMMVIGLVVAKSIKNEEDYYLGGRKLGRWYQFFLNFGNMTDANGAASVSSEVYRQGVGGVWIALQTLFITPFYWFSAVWFRRSRQITMADLFVDRFGSRKLAAVYALFNVFLATLMIGVGYVAAYKVVSAMVVKPVAQYSPAEADAVARYQEFKAFEAQYKAGTFETQDRARYETLQSQASKGELKSFISYISPLPFLAVYGLVIGVYIILGGLSAAVITDAFQGILIILFSVILVPIGLYRLGGFTGLHESVPDYMFELFGSVKMSDYAWHTVIAIVIASMVQIFGLAHNMAVGGSAKNETAARLGAVTGGFTKRFMIIAWLLCGLIAVGLYSNQIMDPDHTWGVLSYNLLVPGVLGLMLAGMLAANMSTVDAAAISISALFVRNLYEPVFPNRSQKHYITAGRIATGSVLLLGAVVALVANNIIPLLITCITLNTVFGAAVLLLFFWRRLTVPAIVISVAIWVVVVGLSPWVLPQMASFRQAGSLLAQTPQRVVMVNAEQDTTDAPEGVEAPVEKSKTKQHVIPPRSVYFDSVAKVRPFDPDSPMEGIGRFNVEVCLVGMLGVPVEKFTASGLTTTRWLFAGIVPFVLLMSLSLLTKRRDTDLVNAFYAKMKTPVQKTPEDDAQAVLHSIATPELTEQRKLFPGSSWEFGKWDRTDTIGFVVCWIAVLVVLAVLWGILNIGR
jgi:SSS family solute:Na+ symporter